MTTQTVEAIAKNYAKDEFCAAKPAIQNFITAYSNAIEANENFIEKELHLLAAKAMQVALDQVTEKITCP